MRPTKTQETEIWQMYDTWLTAYLNADVDTYASYLADDYHFIGSTDNEEFLNRKDTTEFFRATGEQFSGKMDLRNETKTLEQFEDHIFITHFCDVWFENGNDWSYYGRFRLSSVLYQTKESWKFIYQHFSMPDSKSDEGQTIGFDKINAENQELREAIKRRTTELEEKNRDLEIEGALEHVRSRSLAMQTPNELGDVVTVIVEKLTDLGVVLDANGVVLCTYFQDNKNVMHWIASPDFSFTGSYLLPYFEHPIFSEAWQSRLSGVDYFSKAYSKDEKNSFWDYAFKHSDYKHFPQDFKEWVLQNDQHVLSFAWQKNSAILIPSHTGVVPTKAEVAILKRFATVFEQAYTRFLDLQKAEAQTREAKIEAALERVRTQTMAMHDTSELSKVVATLLQELTKLDFSLTFCIINIINLSDNSNTVWATNPEEGKAPESYYMRFEDYPFHRAMMKEWKAQTPKFVYVMEGKEKENYDDYLYTATEFRRFPQEVQNANKKLDRYVASFVFSQFGGLQTVGDQLLSDESLDILYRFGKVFDQTYTRFQDLQKAEAQARESEIELALERVRSRSMAMHKSDELKEVIQVVYDQFIQLEIKIEHAGFILNYKENEDMHIWLADPNAVFPKIVLPYFDCAHWNSFIEAKRKEQNFFTNQLGFEEKNKFYNDLFQFIPGLAEETKTTYFGFEGLAISTVLLDTVGLYVENYKGIPYSDEENAILMRFGKVFQQTYTRFIDLQKAEAQTKKARIEAALEKVRSRSLAMHKSDELNEVVAVLFERLKDLQIPFTAVGIATRIEETKDLNSFVCGENEAGLVITNYRLPYLNNPIPEDLYQALDKQSDFFIGHYSKEEKDTFYEYVIENTAEFRHLPEDIKNMIFGSPNYTMYMMAVKNAVFIINDFEGKVLTETEIDIIKRFARVFDQAYTRFLDLQKAEAQAREAQIQLALERVRARTMAMQTSEELADASKVLDQQVRALGIETWGCAFHIYADNDDGDFEWFSGSKGLLPFYKTPREEVFLKFYEKGQQGEKFHVEEFEGEDCKVHYNFLKTVPVVGDALKALEESGVPLPTYQIDHIAFFNHGYVLFITYEPVPEAHAIFQRFAKIFEQTYTRFLDLQKAEAQAREAQIEAALERVRSKTMAMRNSEDVDITVLTLFEEVSKLGLAKSIRCGIGILQGKEYMETWSATSARNGEVDLKVGILDMTLHPLLVEIKKTWKNGKKGLTYTLEGKKVKEYYKALNNAPEYPFQVDLKKLPNKTYHNSFYFTAGVLFAFTDQPISKEAASVLNRFSGVFDQTYTRFLDLQKAEAQAREAKIETALEKVRSRTMAMQKGDELQEVVVLLYKELIALGVTNFVTCGYVEIREDIKRQYTWVTAPGGDTLGLFYLPLTGDATFDERYTAWQRQQLIFHQTVKGEERSKHLEYAITTFNSKEAEEMVRHQFPDPTVFYCFNFSHGYLHLVGGSYLEKQDENLLARFTKVFEQTYTRFLDLDKAEAQAREAQIETALEKVRSRTMGMQNSDELPEVANNLFLQVQALGIPAWSAGFCIWDENKKTATANMSSEGVLQKPFVLPNVGVGYNFQKPFEKGESFYVEELGGKTIVKHYEFMRTLPIFGEVIDGIIEAGFPLPTFQIFHIVYFSNGYLMFITYEPVPNDWEIFKRFGKVFEQTYTRFLDLEKAEAQAREAKIETALEKVRSRTMGMQTSDELTETSMLLFKQVEELGINSFACGFNIWDDDKKFATAWMASRDRLQPPFKTNSSEDVYLLFHEADKRGESLFILEQKGKELEEHYKYLVTIPEVKKLSEAGLTFPTFQIIYCAYFSKGYLMFITLEPVPEAHDIFKRFAKVFEQTYTRFLDLQKAEAQAGEAKIEAALERIRSRTMGMKASEELAEVAFVLFEQLRALGGNLWGTGFGLCEKDGDQDSFWFANENGVFPPVFIPNTTDPTHKQMFKGWKADKDFLAIEASGKELKNHYDYMMSLPEIRPFFQKILDEGLSFPEWQQWNAAFFKHGYLLIITLEPFPDQDILLRFAKVFEQTYTRFLDLKKSEIQTREAQIENALEKVRSRSLAMQQPEELIEVAQLLRQEMAALGVEALETSSIYIHNKEEGTTQCWFTIKNENDSTKSISDQMTIDLKATWVGRKMQSFYQSSSANTSIVMQGKHRLEWIRYCEEQSTLFSTNKFYGETIPTRTYHLCKFSNGFIGAASPGEISEESWDLLKRATAVFSFAYTRFYDLQKAEKRAKETQIEMALEKIRSRTMTMERSSELADTSVVVFKELLSLGISPNRLFIGIIKNNGDAIEAWATNEDGSKIENQFELHPSENKSIQKMVDAWKREEKSAIIDMRGKELKDYFHYLNKVMHIPFIDGLQQKRRVQTIAYFSGGLIGMAAPEEQPQDTIVLLERFAAVFNLTYTRFNDLKVAEKQALQAEKDLIEIKQARQKAENALIELKATQTQLVQQEKLASLGQLTAGIAHEIKNPLNFVNNFSEVSNELIDEVFEELEKLENSEVKAEIIAILKDVKGNLKKVHEHGTRADNIVKSMLQHSRASEGKREPKAFNSLIKEFVNLSFHGMRANKAPIKVDIDLQLDPQVGEVTIISEDFSRVILNLCNNAFDAMRETAETRPAKLTVRTKQEQGAIRIEVEDNGPGIPDAIKDKILQPFFTTKKGTEGTGLGLSITNDIVKAHGGILDIESKPGRTIFKIQLSL